MHSVTFQHFDTVGWETRKIYLACKDFYSKLSRKFTLLELSLTSSISDWFLKDESWSNSLSVL